MSPPIEQTVPVSSLPKSGRPTVTVDKMKPSQMCDASLKVLAMIGHGHAGQVMLDVSILFATLLLQELSACWLSLSPTSIFIVAND